MVTHWFVVASQKTVKVFTEVPERSRLKLLSTLDNPLGRERTRALIRKQAGMGVKSMGRTGFVRYSQTKRHDPHEEAAIQFSKEIAKFLKKQSQEKNFTSLTIVAEPHFLGKMKSSMEPSLQKMVVKWVKKDLEKTPKSQLPKFLLPNRKKVSVEIPWTSTRMKH